MLAFFVAPFHRHSQQPEADGECRFLIVKGFRSTFVFVQGFCAFCLPRTLAQASFFVASTRDQACPSNHKPRHEMPLIGRAWLLRAALAADLRFCRHNWEC